MTRLANILSIVVIALTASTASTASAQSANQWYFGMSVTLAHGELYVNSVVPYGPAHRAGLETGDRIISVNGSSFWQARSDFEAIQILQSAMNNPGNGGGGTPTLFVQPQAGKANLIVRDVRTYRQVGVTVFPDYRGGGGGIPTTR
jgi:C-terminal processing protease CtpA/Prc